MKKFLTLSVAGFFCILIINSYFTSTEAAISDSVIRLHVIANSDTQADQELKLKVRDRIISEMGENLNKNASKASAREAIFLQLDKIKQIAEDEIRKNGFSYKVRVSLGKSDFPTKDYGDIVLPKGIYEALKVEIGDARGQNWWCVLFPPLCFVDEEIVSFDSTAAKQLLDKVGEGNSELIKKDKSTHVKIKFKSYEIWQSGKQKIAAYFK